MKYTTGIVNRGNLLFSFKFWLITILLVVFYTTMLLAQYSNTVYLDPTNEGDPAEDGTVDHPYDDISDIAWESNTYYRLKRGTTLTTTARVDFDGLHDTKFGVYGSGSERPIVTKTSNGGSVRFSRMSRCWVDSIRFIQPEGMGGAVIGHGGSSSASEPWCINSKITNCEMANGGAGLWSYPFSTGSDTLSIINCEIHNMTSDGIFINSCDNILIEGCHIYDVNTYWFTNPVDADGDGIHLVKECDNYKIYNNIIDKSNTGKKFAFIFGGTNDDPVHGEIIGNTLIPPHIEYGSSAIYISKKQTKIVVARNYITGRQSPSSHPGYIPGSVCYMGADTSIFYCNVIDSMNNGGVFTQDVSYFEFNNNTVVTPMPSSYIVNLTGPTFGTINNNLSAGDCSNAVIRFAGSNTTSSNNTEINSSNTSLYNSGLGILDWETSNFQRTSNANDGIDVGLVYDYDSVLVSNPPERGSCEYVDGTQTNDPPTINNQQFSMNENSSNGSLVGMIEASDPNSGQSLTFSIQSGNTNNAFVINGATGALTVNSSAAIDYETTPEFNLNIQVQDNGIGSLTDQAIVTIDILDVNEVPEVENQQFTVAENSLNSIAVGTVQASDPDNGQTLTFTILSGNIDNAFLINESSGLLTVENSLALDFETNSEFILMIQVTDNGTGSLSSQATITVDVIDVNEAPSIENQAFNLDENGSMSQQVGMVLANDPDIGQTLTYSIVSGNVDNAFSIDGSSGRLSINNVIAIDFETNPVFNLGIHVQDNGAGNLTDQATITVNILDVNDVPIIEDQNLSIDEGSSYNQLVGKVFAEDQDFGQTITFTILSGNTENAFAIDENTGELLVNSGTILDFETGSEYNLVVQVQDDGIGNLTNQADVIVSIDDVNEPPIILNQEFTVLVDKKYIDNELNINIHDIGLVNATDPDWGQDVSFTILKGNEENAFSLNSNTGELRVADPYALYNYEYYNYPLIVKAQDNSPEQLQSIATINLYVHIDTALVAERDSELLINRDINIDEFSMKVYPNPANNYFEIELDNIEPGSVSILIATTSGEIVSKSEIFIEERNFLQKYNVDNFRNGVYIIRIKNNSAVYFSKIVKL